MQGYADPYKPGTCEELLKWKFAHLNSVDFLLNVQGTGGICPDRLPCLTACGLRSICCSLDWLHDHVKERLDVADQCACEVPEPCLTVRVPVATINIA